MLPHEVKDMMMDMMMKRTLQELNEQFMNMLLKEHLRHVAALRATLPAPGCVRSFCGRRGLVIAVTVDVVWMVDALGQFRVA